MTGEERREGILERIRQAKAPVAARALAELYGVSRQVIVQDIALIRASGHEIFSTNRGYILLQKEKPAVRVFKVCHTDEQLEDELLSIVDLGGCVENVDNSFPALCAYRLKFRHPVGGKRMEFEIKPQNPVFSTFLSTK